MLCAKVNYGFLAAKEKEGGMGSKRCSNHNPLQPRVLCQAAVVSQDPPGILDLHALSITSYSHLVAICQRAVLGI